jgi:hypothetical protein
MNKKDEAKLSMYKAVEAHCTNNQTIIATSVPFQASFTTFVAKLASLFVTESSAQKQTKGIAVDKEALKQLLVKDAFEMASVVFAFASKTKNDTLRQAVNYSITDLDRLKDELIVPVASNIKKAASDNLTALAEYGVTTAKITAMQVSMDNYAAATQKPRLAKAQKTTDNKNVKTVMQEIDNILKNEMDKTIVVFKAANPNFVIKYKEVRIIVNPGAAAKKANPKDEAPKK